MVFFFHFLLCWGRSSVMNTAASSSRWQAPKILLSTTIASDDLGCESTPILAAGLQHPQGHKSEIQKAAVLGDEMEIAVGALSGMVDALPGKLGELLQQELDLLSGVRGDVAFFQAELGAMHAAVVRCEALDEPDSQTTTWIGQVRELAYDIEDWVDLFAHRVDAGRSTQDADAGTISTRERFSRWIRRGIDRFTTIPDRHIIATELQDLRRRVVEVSDQRKRYSFGPQTIAAGSRYAAAVDHRLIALYADSASLVGLEGPRDEVAEMVAGAGSGGLKVVSIVGMAGSGKTTLAREVYRLIGAGFTCRASVSVGRNADIAKVLGDMLSQVDSEYKGRGDSGDPAQLIGRLRLHLQDKRYLVMIDDLWSTQTWGTIKYCFPASNLGSRIITTTRIDGVAKVGNHVYKTRLLEEANAETLFFRRTFGSKGVCPHHLKDVSTQIMRKCGGLPLAIVSVGSMLASKQLTRDEFERSGLHWQENSQLQGMKQSIKLSYNDLPANLKTCLLYLSIFPENYVIEIPRLVRRWIAEGLISEQRGPSTEEIARNYISELIGRNLVQPSQLNHDATHRSCAVHPVIHDFIVCKSMEDNFVALVHAQQQDVSPGNGTIRRLSLLNSAKLDQAKAQIDGGKVSRARSITAISHTSGTPRLNELSVLRVLDLEGCEGPLCLDGLCKLLLLRYLNLTGTDISELPAQIGELRCLETLDVRFTKVKELPPSILRLEKLKHLLAGNAKLPSGISKMKSLLTLSCNNVGENPVSVMHELGEISSLRELELFCDVTGTSGGKKQVEFSGDGFRSLEKLRIRCSLPSVTFMNRALPKLAMLELKFEKGLSVESSGVSGIELLTSLKHLLIDSQHDTGAADAMAEVRKVVHPNCQVITMSADGKSG